MILCRKVQIVPVGDKEEIDRVYKYIREGMENQNRAMNQYMSALYMAMMEDASLEDRKELNKLYSRISTSKKGSAYETDIVFPKGLDTSSALSQKVKQDFDTQMKKGLKYGRVSLATYKADNPLLIHVDYVRLRDKSKKKCGLYHEYKDNNELYDYLEYENNVDVFIKFANAITFKVVFGNPYKSAELRSVFKKIFNETYSVCGSTIQISKGKIILNLSIDMPVSEKELDENTVCGVDLGLNIPAMCGLNNSGYIKKAIGNKDDFLRVRTEIQEQRRRLSKNLVSNKGGHGRKKKLSKLEKMKAKERNFCKTYNHYVSRNVVDFAEKNNAKYINLEKLENIDTDKFILRNWSYYELQKQIEYKAKMKGIKVRYINPTYTSQKCSRCGYIDSQNRPKEEKGQAYFKCIKCGYSVNADFNASVNIALSTDFVE